MADQNQSRISEAIAELSGYRDDGEDPIDNLELVAAFHSVPVNKLRDLAESKWGAPLETDRERNADHFKTAEQRNAESAQAHVHRNEVLGKAKYSAVEIWGNCCPNGEPDWSYCAKRFLSLNKINEVSLREEIIELFLKIGKDFQKSVSLYNKWAR